MQSLKLLLSMAKQVRYLLTYRRLLMEMLQR
jgi:hypothetical protein